MKLDWMRVYGNEDNSELIIKLPVGTVAAYIEMNGRTHYIDGETGEAIAQSWRTREVGKGKVVMEERFTKEQKGGA